MSEKTETYIFNDAAYGTHSLIAQEIGEHQSVLDVGCNKGYLKRLAPNNEFYGIDFSEDDLKQALDASYAAVFQLDLNRYEEFVCDRKFDVIIFADILEHLMYPQAVLDFFLQKYLKEGGKVIVSLPNVANATVRLDLLFGKFDYTENGILDRTHLHLYTKKSARLLLEGAGLRMLKKKYSSNRFGRVIEALPLVAGLLAFNLIFVCRKK